MTGNAIRETVSTCSCKAPVHPCGDLAHVSDRERDIMNVLSRGFTNTEIAQELFISEKTVKNHINRLFAKLGARHRAEAMAIWLGLAHTSKARRRMTT